MKHTTPVTVTMFSGTLDYTMELDTEQAGSVLFSPTEYQRESTEAAWERFAVSLTGWPPDLSIPSVDLVATVYFFRKLDAARERVAQRLRARGRSMGAAHVETRDLPVVINSATIGTRASASGSHLWLTTPLETIIGEIPLSIGLNMDELSDIMEYLAVIDETERTMAELGTDTTKMLAAIAEDRDKTDATPR